MNMNDISNNLVFPKVQLPTSTNIKPVQFESSIDKMTLQYLTNKKTYNKYLSIQDPEYSVQLKTFQNKIHKHQNDIISILTCYLEDTNKQITTDLDEGARHFLSSCIKYIDMKELEESTNGGCYETHRIEEDELFPDLEEEHSSSEIIRPPVYSSHKNSSYWGKPIQKIDYHDMNLFVRTKKR